jgi:hypothetical protein
MDRKPIGAGSEQNQIARNVDVSVTVASLWRAAAASKASVDVAIQPAPAIGQSSDRRDEAAGHGTFQTCRLIPRTSASRGRTEVSDARSK